jgi:hypothetical protein
LSRSLMIDVNMLKGVAVTVGLALLDDVVGANDPEVVLLPETVVDLVEDVVVVGLVMLGDEVAVDSVDVCGELVDSLFDALLVDVLV